MLYLVSAVVCSALIALILRLAEQKVGSTILMFLTNYIVCALLSLCYLGGQSLLPSGSGAGFALLLGLAGGAMFLGNFGMLQLNIRKNGVVLASVFMKLGVLVPIAMAVLAFHEVPTVPQVLGFLLAVAAILVINLDPTQKQAAGNRALLIALLLLGGFTDSFMNIYDKVGDPAWKDHFLLYIFLCASVICLVITLYQKKKPCAQDLLFGLILGVPNYYSSRCLLLSLRSVPAVVAYPVYNVATIVVVSLAGMLLFRETLNRRKSVGIGLILLALVLLNL